MAATGIAKSSAVTATPMVKAGQAWDYDDPYLTYDGEFDAEGRRVLYDAIGTAATATGMSKSATVTATALTKNNA